MSDIKISLDAMGGDFGASVVVPAGLYALKKYPNLTIVFVGDKETIESYLNSTSTKARERIDIKHTTQMVEMDESPSLALRSKKDSSMRVAINLVKDGQVQACVSAGNTGALMATARYVLKTHPGIDRPAIISVFPTSQGCTRVLDLGANVDSSAEHLLQFAIMGSALCTALDNNPAPKVGLLNVGEEEIKGNEQVKNAAVLLSENTKINYIGYLEGNDLWTGEADLVVCDGFVGNVTIKAIEGFANFSYKIVKDSFTKNIFHKVLALLTIPLFKSVKEKLNTKNYNGASFIGLQGIVVKSHGHADVEAFVTAIEEAINEIEHDAPRLIKDYVDQYFNHN